LKQRLREINDLNSAAALLIEKSFENSTNRVVIVRFQQ
jgi:hypothetical protein